jgi:hypothetical protein
MSQHNGAEVDLKSRYAQCKVFRADLATLVDTQVDTVTYIVLAKDILATWSLRYTGSF